ncbi:hypothetical protein Ocin01_18458 [Orchesella cincta]|uniref:Uncharacterized protein n=1 Tax=Orchesella cincta TaxID=48709 RepID=A0A1D2M5H4_ORCCI|nr:hypothetical protein Ocin01_18458 [Orchesella cincta]
MVGEKIPLSEYLGTGSPDFNKGYGIKRWERIDNCEETFAENFFDIVKAAIARKYRQRCPDATFMKSIFDRYDGNGVASASPKIGDNEELNFAGFKTKSGRYLESYEEFISKLEKSSKSPAAVSLSIVETKEVLSRSISTSSPCKSNSSLPTDEVCDALLDALNDTRSYVEIEGMHCSKMMLAKWATRYLLQSKKTAEVPSQTDFPKSEEISVGCQTDPVPITRNPEGQNSLLGEYGGQQNLAWNNVPNTMTNSAPTNQAFYYQPRFSTSSYQSRPSTSSYQPNQCNRYYNRYQVNQTKLQQALNWQPRNDDQKKTFHEVKEDLFNVLVVSKCINYGYVIKEFQRIVPEPLNFAKLGMPDLRTLLIQMRDCVTLKKQRFTEQYFVFPKLTGETFETVSHIAELVAEQRDRDIIPIPHESTLVECDLSDLFVEEVTYFQHTNSNLHHQMPQNYNYWYYAAAAAQSSQNFNNYYRFRNYSQQDQNFHQNCWQWMHQFNSAKNQNSMP